MVIRHPFQKLCCVQSSQHHQGLLFAASGPTIFTFQQESGNVTSHWSAIDVPDNLLVETILKPNKRRKLDEEEQNGNSSRQESEESIEISVERRKGERRKPKIEQLKAPNVSHLVATSDGNILVAVTAEDKSIHVFDIVGVEGVLRPKSTRSMPKRICAIVLDPNGTNIVIGDKFGDVYSLPVHPAEDYVPPTLSNETFRPSATELTVHTKGNLEALRQQREQKKVNLRKEGPDFEHKLLLGHVSLLTDVLIAKIQVMDKSQAFIMTSDRDEHIRVSRYPQTHIIEGYCLGHRDFIGRLCVPCWAPHYLISGGGEPSVKIYDWRSGRVVDQESFDKELRSAIQEMLDLGREGRSSEKVAVSGMLTLNCKSLGRGVMGDDGLLLVTLEGLPLIISFLLDTAGNLQHQQTIKVSRNVLDMAQVQGGTLVIVSLDTAHAVGSMKVMNTKESLDNMMVAFELVGETPKSLEWRPAQIAETLNVAINDQDNVPVVPQPEAAEGQRYKGGYSSLGEFLYGLENLRKRRGHVADEAEDEVDCEEPTEIIE